MNKYTLYLITTLITVFGWVVAYHTGDESSDAFIAFVFPPYSWYSVAEYISLYFDIFGEKL